MVFWQIQVHEGMNTRLKLNASKKTFLMIVLHYIVLELAQNKS